MKKKEIIQTQWSLPQLSFDGSHSAQSCKMNGFTVTRLDFHDYFVFYVEEAIFYFASLSQVHSFVSRFKNCHKSTFYQRYKKPFNSFLIAASIAKSNGKLWSMC